MADLAKLVAEWDRIEFHSDADVERYAKALRRLGEELYLRVEFDAQELQAILSAYPGRWYTFGAESRVRAKLVGAHLRVGAAAARSLAIAAIKMAMSFRKHFVAPEMNARQRRRSSSSGKSFKIGGE